MIVTKQKLPEEIFKMVDSYNNIFLIGCGECSATCKTGGEKEVLQMKDYLEGKGKRITDWVVPDAPCVASKIKTALAQHIPALKESDCILVMSCGLGVQSVKEQNRFGQEVFPALDSICGSLIDAKGNFLEVCSSCSECILDKTACICPITRCSKGLLNGPCGGVIKGKCEVDKDRDCAWVLIYKELEKRNKLDKMKAIFSPKDHSKTTKPHKIIIGN